MLLNDGTNIWYESKKGKKQPFVFIHGNAQNHTIFTDVINALHKKGHHTVSYDLPGHGRSEPYKNKKYSMLQFAQTLQHIIKQTHCQNPVIVGHSLGGMIALQYAAAFPVHALVLTGTADVDPIKVNNVIPLKQIVSSIVKDAYKLAEKRQPFTFSAPMSDEQVLAAGLRCTNPDALKANFNATKRYNVRMKLSKLSCPVLIIRGRNDMLMTEKMTSDMVKRIKKVKAVQCAGGHNFFLQHKGVLHRYIMKNYRFLTSVSSPPNNTSSAYHCTL
ncbi:MAG TPA: alpha/beta hydrolase [Candidatus Nanoarchaeia archaeon]|nr:alpha/beta hydrolase [Candidatus Nanoarchaeia archaeon]